MYTRMKIVEESELHLGSAMTPVIIKASKPLFLSMYHLAMAYNGDGCNKIKAIKEIRNFAMKHDDGNNVGLKEAKYFVEAVCEDRFSTVRDDIYRLF